MAELSDVETASGEPTEAVIEPREAADAQASAAQATGADAPVADAPAPIADDVLLAAVDLARRALEEITPASTIGEPAGHIVEGESTLSLLFATTLPGYPGWHWTVSLARVDGAEPTVLEAELMPGGEALLAPDWVPWSERLADYRAAQAAAAAAAAAADEDDDEPDDDELDYDYDDDVDIDVFGEDGDDADDDGFGDDVLAGPAGEHDDESDDSERDADGARGQGPVEAAGVEVVTPDEHGDQRE